MPTSAGSFCWIELNTPDQNAAKAFYGGLLGWTSYDFPTCPGEFYTMFRLGGKDVGAAESQGPVTHWSLYVAVDSADDSAKLAEEAGGKVLAGPLDAGESGRMAVIQDPTGAVICVWQAKNNAGFDVTGVHGAFCWADLNTPDATTAMAFYSKLFGWTTDSSKDGSGYLHLKNGESYIGGVPPGCPGHPNWTIYIQTDDCVASADKAKELGATLYMAPMKMEGVGTMAVVADPQGAVFSLFQLENHL